MTGGGEPEVSAWWRGELSRTGQLAYRFRDSGASCQLVIRSARSQRVEPPCGIGWFAVGDAAMAFDPMSSQGIAKARSEEHTSELQSPDHLVCRLLLEKKKKRKHIMSYAIKFLHTTVCS